MKKSIYSNGILAFGIMLLLNSCYPNGPEFVDELDIVLSNYDDEYNFQALKTYYMPDSIARVGDGNDDPVLSPADDHRLLNRIENNLVAYGYQRLDESQSQEEADFVMLVSSTSSTFYSYWWDYWGWWPGWGYYPPGYGPGWGWGCYYGCYSGYSWSVGSLIMQMVDPNQPDEGLDEIPMVWLGGVNGLIQGTPASIVSRGEKGIDQAFAQSPYLKLN